MINYENLYKNEIIGKTNYRTLLFRFQRIRLKELLQTEHGPVGRPLNGMKSPVLASEDAPLLLIVEDNKEILWNVNHLEKGRFSMKILYKNKVIKHITFKK